MLRACRYNTGSRQANISDCIRDKNIFSFGTCQLSPDIVAPCTYGICGKWVRGKENYTINGELALLKTSFNVCSSGGIISIINDGQIGPDSMHIGEGGRTTNVVSGEGYDFGNKLVYNSNGIRSDVVAVNSSGAQNNASGSETRGYVKVFDLNGQVGTTYTGKLVGQKLYLQTNHQIKTLATSLDCKIEISYPSAGVKNQIVLTVSKGNEKKEIPVSGLSDRTKQVNIDALDLAGNIPVSTFKDLKIEMEWDAVRKTAVFYKFKTAGYCYYKHEGAVTIHVIKTHPKNIVLKNLHETKSIHDSKEFGANGGFFNMGGAKQLPSGLSIEDPKAQNINLYGTLHMAVQDGSPVVTEEIAKAFYRDGRVNLEGNSKGVIVYTGSSLMFESKKGYLDVVSGPSSYIWAQGGYRFLVASPSWKSVLVDGDGYAIANSKHSRTAMIKDDTFVYLIATVEECTAQTFLEAIRGCLSIKEGQTEKYQGLMLDGGGSSQIRCNNRNGGLVNMKASNRSLVQVICLSNKEYNREIE